MADQDSAKYYEIKENELRVSVKEEISSGTTEASTEPELEYTLGKQLRFYWILFRSSSYRKIIIYSLLWLIILWILVYLSFFAASVNGEEPEWLSCRSWAYWQGPNCGLNGIDCQPFRSDFSAIRCPTRCTWDQSDELEVIGSGPYHASSRICKAAIHAGVIGSNGGCALLRFTGAQIGFNGSSQNGVDSTSYDSWFPKSYELAEADSSLCTDISWPIMVLLFIALAGLAWFPFTSPLYLFVIACWSGYWYVVLIGQPVSSDYRYIFANGLADMFVVLAVCYVLYYIAPIYTFSNWTNYSRKERLVYWGGWFLIPYFLMLNLNLFQYIPWLNFDIGGYRFEEKDNEFNALTYVAIAVCGIAGLAAIGWHFVHLYLIRKAYIYLLSYSCGVTVALICYSMIASDYGLHMHHLILGLLLLPFTRFSRVPSFILQALAIGLVIQGYAAWGFESYVEKEPVILTIPSVDPPIATGITSFSANVSWAQTENVEGYALMLNGVEVFRDTQTSFVVNGLEPNLTYYLTVSGIGANGADGVESSATNFTTLGT